MRRRAPSCRREEPPAAPPPWRVTLHSMVEDQSDDLWGLAFLLVAVLAGLGIYAQVIGPAGHVLRSGTADVLGWPGTAYRSRLPSSAGTSSGAAIGVNRPGWRLGSDWPSWPRPVSWRSWLAKTR